MEHGCHPRSITIVSTHFQQQYSFMVILHTVCEALGKKNYGKM